MQKNLLLCIIVAFTTIVLPLQAQQGEFAVGVLAEHSYYFDKGGLPIGGATTAGLDVQFFVLDNLSLDYQLQAGFHQNHGFYLNTGWGQAGCLYLLAKENYSMAGAALLALMIPEGISGHIPIADKIVLSPYAHPLEAHFNYYDNPTNWHWAGDFGLRISYVFKNGMSIQPHISGRWWYFRKTAGINAGLSVTLWRGN